MGGLLSKSKGPDVPPTLRPLRSPRPAGLSLPAPERAGSKFANPASWGFVTKGGTDVLKWKLKGGPPKMPSEAEIRRVTGWQRPDLASWAEPAAGVLQHTWIGHASYLVQLGGHSFLFDPVFSERCSPVQFAGPKRALPPPATIEELPKIDFVCISHNHYVRHPTPETHPHRDMHRSNRTTSTTTPSARWPGGASTSGTSQRRSAAGSARRSRTFGRRRSLS